MKLRKCLTDETVTAYLEGVLNPGIRAITERHAVECDECRERLSHFLQVLNDDITPGEEEAVDQLMRVWTKQAEPAPRRKRKVQMLAAAVLLAGFVGLLFVTGQEPIGTADEVIPLLLARVRPFESRMSDQAYIRAEEVRNAETQSIEFGAVATEMARLKSGDLEWGRFYLLQRQFETAIERLEKGAAQSATAATLNDLGVAHLENGDMQRSLILFQEALALNPEFAPAIHNLAIYYEQANDLPNAERVWNRYLELDVDSDWAAEARARLEIISRVK